MKQRSSISLTNEKGLRTESTRLHCNTCPYDNQDSAWRAVLRLATLTLSKSENHRPKTRTNLVSFILQASLTLFCPKVPALCACVVSVMHRDVTKATVQLTERATHVNRGHNKRSSGLHLSFSSRCLDGYDSLQK